MKERNFNQAVFDGRSVHTAELVSIASSSKYSVIKISDEVFDCIDVKPYRRSYRHHANCAFPAYATEISDVSGNVLEAVVISVDPPHPPILHRLIAIL